MSTIKDEEALNQNLKNLSIIKIFMIMLTRSPERTFNPTAILVLFSEKISCITLIYFGQIVHSLNFLKMYAIPLEH